MARCSCCPFYELDVCPFRKAAGTANTTDGDVDRKVRPVELLAPGTWPNRRTQMTGVMGRLSARVFLAMALGEGTPGNDNQPPGAPQDPEDQD